MKYNIKNLLILFSLIIFFVFFWYMQNHSNINHLDNQNILLLMNDSQQGYTSLKMISLFYTLFFLLIAGFHLKDSTQIIIRSRSRNYIYIKRLVSIFIIASVYTFIYTLVNVLLIYFYVDFNIIDQSKFLLISCLNWIGMTLFYFWIGIMGKVIEDKLQSVSYSIIIPFILIALSYFIKVIPWLPIKDMQIQLALLTDSWGILELIMVYIRQIGLVIVFGILGKMVFLEKDF